MLEKIGNEGRRKKVNEGSAQVTYSRLKENLVSVCSKRIHALTQESPLLPIVVNYVFELRKFHLFVPLTNSHSATNSKKKQTNKK